MATHSSTLAWRIPGTVEPVGLPVYGVAQSRTRLKQLSSSVVVRSRGRGPMIRSQSFSKLVPLECELHMFLSLFVCLFFLPLLGVTEWLEWIGARYFPFRI